MACNWLNVAACGAVCVTVYWECVCKEVVGR